MAVGPPQIRPLPRVLHVRGNQMEVLRVDTRWMPERRHMRADQEAELFGSVNLRITAFSQSGIWRSFASKARTIGAQCSAYIA
jgi:hypothetical protein